MKPYAGDIEFSKILGELRIPYTLGEVKAYLMGTIAATHHAPMQAVLDHIYGGQEIVYENKEQAEEFYSNLMGLWNQLTAHQFPDKPFRFTPLGMPANPRDIKNVLSVRSAEILQFIRGLDAGGTDPREFSEDGRHSLRYLAEGDAILKGVIEVSERDKDASEATLNALIDNLKRMDAIIHDCVHQIILEANSIRLEKIKALKEKEAIKQQVHRVGRNDSCPCGSGFKFKKCCLTKLQ